MVESISPREALGLVSNQFAVIVDVREKDEIAAGMAGPAQWIANTKIEANDQEWKDFVAKLPKNKKIICYCRSGARSGRAAAKLAAMGFKAANMGGFEGWVSENLPVKKP